MSLLNKNNSIFFILCTAIFTLITIGVSFRSFLNYTYIKDQTEERIRNDLKISSLQLKSNLLLFLQNDKKSEFDKIVMNELQHKNIYAIVIDNYGFIKDEKSNIVKFNINETSQLNNLEYMEKVEVVDTNNTKLFELKLYGTDYYIKKELKEIIIKNLLISILIFMFIFSFLYLVLRKLLIRPINNMINFLKKRDISSKLEENSSKEISFLSDAINTMIVDIKNSHDELENSKLKWQFAVEGNGDGLWEWDIKTDQFYFSKQWKKMLGYEDNEITNNLFEWENRVHKDDFDRVNKDIDNYINSTRKNYVNEHRMLCKDGTYKWVLDRGIIIKRDENNNPLFMIGTYTDISKRKDTEKLMKQALSVFENTHDGIMITDSSKKILSINPAFTKTTGYTLKDVEDKTPNILNSGKQNLEFFSKMWQKIDKEGFWAGEIINKKKNGKLYDEYLTVSSIKNKEGDIENYIGIFSDITLQKEQERMLIQQARNSAIGEMIGNIAHQWRQPLSVISTASTGLKLMISLQDDVSKSEIIDVLENVNKQSQYLSKTIEDFRNFFREDLTNKVKFGLGESIRKVEELTKDVFKNNFVYVEKNIDNELYILGNENILVQAIINIYNNALDAFKSKNLDDKRLFFITIRRENNKIVLRLKDNAGGIFNESIQRVFEPYFTTKHQSVGTGLGLYMTQQIITKQLNGEITVKNSKFTYEDIEYIGAEFIMSWDIEDNNQ